MEPILREVEERLKELEEMREEILIKLRHLPEGSLRISHSNGNIQYYHRRTPSERGGRYISRKEKALVRGLAQREYYLQVLEAIDEEMRCLEEFMRDFPGVTAEEAYLQLAKDRAELVDPVEETDEEFVKRWLSRPYESMGFEPDAPEYYTDNGERVRSKSEVIIANMLSRHNIPYLYEYPVPIAGRGVFRADFSILNVRCRKEFICEHFGLMDQPGYAENAIQKMILYHQNGYWEGKNLLYFFETSKVPLDTRVVEAIIRRFLL